MHILLHSISIWIFAPKQSDNNVFWHENSTFKNPDFFVILVHCVHRFLGTEIDTFLQKFEKKNLGYDTLFGVLFVPNFLLNVQFVKVTTWWTFSSFSLS